MKQSRLRLITIGPAFLFVILLLAFGVLLAISAQTSNTNLRNAVREVSRPITNTSSKLLFNPVYNLDITEANNVISQFVDGETIVYAAVYDVSVVKLTDVTGEWIPETGVVQSLSSNSINTNSPQEQEVDQYLLIAEPISAGSQVIGTVVYSFDQSILQAGLTQSQFILTLAILVVLAAASVLVYLFMRNALAPLTHLSEVAQRIGSGELSTQVEVEGYQEVASLATALDSMRVDLQESYSNLEERVAARTKDLATVANISTVTATIRDPEQMLANMVHLTQRGFSLYHAHVFTYNKEDEELGIVACGYRQGEEHEGTHGTTTIPMGQQQSLVALAARTRQPVIVNDVRNEPGWLPNPLLPETRAELAVPMIVGDELLGVLDVQSERLDAFTEEDANIQMTLASQIATALQNTISLDEAQKRAETESLANVIGQRIQRTTSIEETLQTAIRELGTAIGASSVRASIKPAPADDTRLEETILSEEILETEGEIENEKTLSGEENKLGVAK